MSDSVIRVVDLSKQYRIDGKQEAYRTLRDTLTDALIAPFRRVGQLVRGIPLSAAVQHETIWALKDVCCEIKSGEAVGIIGRNGSGKSTLLKILARITEPTTGFAEVHGRVGSLLEVGTGFHQELTGRENIYLNGAILGMRRMEIERKFDEIIAFAEVEKFVDTPVKYYSSGMYLRLAFAVAAHLEPEILLIDEVLAVGDVAFQKKCLDKMSEVTRGGRTVLFVSHNMAAVEQLCSRAILLSNGQISMAGSVARVVGSYLATHERRGSTAEGVLARNASGSVELIAVGPVDEEGRPLLAAQCGRNLHLSIRLRTHVRLPRVTVSVGINTLHDTRVTVLHSSIAGHDLSFIPGTHSIVCRVPQFPLPAGMYLMDVKVYSGFDVALWAPGSEQLTVEAGDFYRTGRLPSPSWGGLCYLEQDWKVYND
jgi:lipopolysaccharide transport system ATP-binding protein